MCRELNERCVSTIRKPEAYAVIEHNGRRYSPGDRCQVSSDECDDWAMLDMVRDYQDVRGVWPTFDESVLDITQHALGFALPFRTLGFDQDYECVLE